MSEIRRGCLVRRSRFAFAARLTTLALVAGFLVSGCVSDSTSVATDDSGEFPEPDPTYHGPDFTYTVMTYNILGGAGVGCDSIAAEPGDRLEKVIRVIEMIDPDVLGIQEARCWRDNQAGTARQVAERLGMLYFLGDADPNSSDPRLGHVVLYSNFEISETENYPEPFSRGTLRAELQTPWGEPLNVFVTHLSPEGAQWYFEFPALANYVRGYGGQQTLVMGDFNALPMNIDFGDDFLRIAGEGWDWIYGERSVGTDPNGDHYFRRVRTGLSEQELYEISDHLPVAVEIGVYK